MASNRHLGRIIALQTLYEQEVRSEAGDNDYDATAVLARNIDRYRDQVDDVAFIEQLVKGVSEKAELLDKQLQPVAPEWPIDQIARMDRIVLRIGLYELNDEADVPPKVVINEAVELAKAFGGDNSSKFVNGVLGTLLRQTEAPAEASKKAPAKKAAVKKPAAKKVTKAKPAKAPTKKK
ncbi:MAG TPA: transcription antitermination factor NusB [Candidatus Saccharimonadales bacterium]|nr:transcription antitermination factor NusB [Candidatus Saccharimonadales bacterium]